MLIDTHLHWDAEEYDADREDLLAAARAAGIGLFVVPGVVPGLFARQAEKCRDVPEARLAWGVHPLYVHEVQRHAEALAGAKPDGPGACAAAARMAVAIDNLDIVINGTMSPIAAAASAGTDGWHTASICAPGPICSIQPIR